MSRSRSIKVPILARVEGEGALHLRLSGDRVTDVKLEIFEPPRFFEGFLIDRFLQEKYVGPGRLPCAQFLLARDGEGAEEKAGAGRLPSPPPTC